LPRKKSSPSKSIPKLPILKKKSPSIQKLSSLSSVTPEIKVKEIEKPKSPISITPLSPPISVMISSPIINPKTPEFSEDEEYEIEDEIDEEYEIEEVDENEVEEDFQRLEEENKKNSKEKNSKEKNSKEKNSKEKNSKEKNSKEREKNKNLRGMKNN